MPQGGFTPPEEVKSQEGLPQGLGPVGRGRNARLAARLTGYKIDIKPASFQEEEFFSGTVPLNKRAAALGAVLSPTGSLLYAQK